MGLEPSSWSDDQVCGSDVLHLSQIMSSVQGLETVPWSAESGQVHAGYLVGNETQSYIGPQKEDIDKGIQLKDLDVWALNTSLEPAFHSTCMLYIRRLTEALKGGQDLLYHLNRELEQERTAAATAANEAVSTISRLQKEKTLLQMEARHYTELVEVKLFHDQETISLLKEIIIKQDAEKAALEDELEKYKRVLGIQKRRVREEDLDEGLWEPLSTVDVSFGGKDLDDSIFGGKLDPFTDLEGTDKNIRPSICSVKPVQLCEENTFPDTGVEKAAANPRWTDLQIAAHKIDSNFEHHGYTHVQKFSQKGTSLDVALDESWQVLSEQLLQLHKYISCLRTIKLTELKEHASCKKGGKSLCIHGSMNQSKQSSEQRTKYARSLFDIKCSLSALNSHVIDACNHEEKFEHPKQSSTFEGRLPDFLCCKYDERTEVFLNTSNSIECLGFHVKKKEAHVWEEHARLTPCNADSLTCTNIEELQEQIELCENKLQAFDTFRIGMVEVIKMMKENVRKPDVLLVFATDLLEEFLSFTDSSSLILGLFCKLLNYLSDHVKGGDGMSLADVYHISELGMPVENYISRAIEEANSRESNAEDMDPEIGSLSWSSTLAWLNDERGRAETALSGWDC